MSQRPGIGSFPSAAERSIVLVTGLSGGGKASILRALEDVGFEAVDNPPLAMLSEMVTRTDKNLAIGVDARTLGFDADSVLQTIVCLRADTTLRVELVYAWADEIATGELGPEVPRPEREPTPEPRQPAPQAA